MIDYHSNLVSALQTIGIDVHYEMVLHSGLTTPCISYMELNNSMAETGDTLGYSNIQYQISIWSNDIADLQKYAVQVDAVLRPLGWRRISSGEMYDNNSTMCRKLLIFEALALEQFN